MKTKRDFFRLSIFRAFAIQCVLVAGSSAHAAPCVASSRAQANQVVIAQQSAALSSITVIPQGFIAVPFAVPVAVPSYVQYQAQAVTSDEGRVTREEKQAHAVEARHSPLTPQHSALSTQHCAKCHSGDTAKKGFHVDRAFSYQQRLQAISRILADDPTKRMPKGTRLDAEAIGLLIQELSRVPRGDAEGLPP